MASYEEQLFWQEHLPHFFLKGDSAAPRKWLGTQELSNCVPISLSSSSPSPLVTLPVELLCRIFSLTIRDSSDMPNTFAFVEQKHLAKLIQICRYWRVVALSNPTFWSSIGAYDIDQSTLNRIRLWLIRAGPTCPLSLFLGFSHKRDPTQILHDILELFIANCSRWHDIYFQISDIRALQMLAGLPLGAARQLNCMRLHCQPGLPLELEYQAWTTLGSSPNLHTLDLDGNVEDELGLIPPLPWHQLTTLTLYLIDCQATMNILKDCHRLERLRILSPICDGFPTQVTPITLPSLRKLEVRIRGDSGPILNLLTTPNLQDLMICQCTPKGTQPGPVHLNQFLARSQCPLEFIDFKDFELSEGEFLHCIQSPILSNLKVAKLSGNLSDTIIEALTARNTDTHLLCLLPSLHSILLEGWNASNTHVLEEMIRMRSLMSKGGLKSVELLCERDLVSSKFVADIKEAFNVAITCSAMY